MSLVSINDIRQAANRISPACLLTPVLPVDAAAGSPATSRLWIKAESLQRTGSFKLRGATNAIAQLTAEQRAAGVATYSSGNHGQAVAAAAAAFGARCTVVMPTTASERKIERTRGWGARVILVPAAERSDVCRAIAAHDSLHIVEPFDDAQIVAGQGTVGLEIGSQLPDVRVVLVPVGGGGLISGVAAALKAIDPGIRVIGVEPDLAGDLAEGFVAGERRTWRSELTTRTIADGLQAPAVGALNWAHMQAYVDDVVTVSEDAIVAAMHMLAIQLNLIVEPSGAVAAAAYLTQGERLPAGVTAAIASGGNVALATFADMITSLPDKLPPVRV